MEYWKPLLRLNGFLYLYFNNKTYRNTKNKANLDYEIVLGFRIYEKLYKASVLLVSLPKPLFFFDNRTRKKVWPNIQYRLVMLVLKK